MTTERTRRAAIRRQLHDDRLLADGVAAGRRALAGDVKARIELVPRALTVQLSTGLYVHVDDVLALIDEEARR